MVDQFYILRSHVGPNRPLVTGHVVGSTVVGILLNMNVTMKVSNAHLVQYSLKSLASVASNRKTVSTAINLDILAEEPVTRSSLVVSTIAKEFVMPDHVNLNVLTLWTPVSKLV